MLGVQPAEMLMVTKAIGLVTLILLCIADPWWLRFEDLLLRIVPRFDL
jgi:hypothetical protein